MLMHNLLTDGAMRHPEKPAFTWVDRNTSLSYAQAAVAVDRMAGALNHLGVVKGDRVTVFAHNGMDYLLAMFATWRIGAIAALVNVKFQADLAYYLADHTPRVLIYTHDMRDAVNAAVAQAPGIEHLVCMDGEQPGAHSLPQLMAAEFASPRDPGDENALAHLSYTSGTTGKPKGACLCHEPTVRATRCIAERLRITGNDITFGPTALSSSYQLVGNLLPALANGASVNIMRFWTPEAGWDALEAARATVLVGNPTLLEELRAQSAVRGRAPGRLRFGLSGGGPVPTVLKRAWRDQLALPLVESFGQSELGGFMALGHPELEADDRKLMRVGPPLPDKEVWMVGTDGKRLRPGEVGEIVLRGGYMWGYWNKPEKTRETLQGGLLRTGDLGMMDDEGFVTMRGRRSELLMVDGFSWFPRDVEEALCRQPGVRQAALIGLPDGERGMRPFAFITRHAGAPVDLERLKSVVQAEIPYSLEAMVLGELEEFPMTPTGKIAKGELTEQTMALL
ncbi:MAG: AMP-dependent synthetase [Ramlibacter sp.]|nr:AMP-dependent synthetase [Ramlibacter sp.]